MNASTSEELRREIVFFDVETAVPYKEGQRRSLFEFGAILVCPQRLLEISCYSTLIKPADFSSNTSNHFRRLNGINKDSIDSAPSFGEVADVVYYFLHGRVWAGHNISNFDCDRIHEAFAEIGRPAPEPKRIFDTLTFFTEKFGRRAGTMKMKDLANYFGLGAQTHRSLDDVRMNLEVVKYCSAVLFLESSLPNIFTTNTEAEVLPTVKCNRVNPIEGEPKQPDARMSEIDEQDYLQVSSNAVSNEGCSGYAGLLDLDDVSVPSISASLACSNRGQKIQLLHKDVLLQLCCAKLRVCFGVDKNFIDNAGRPRLSIVVDSPSSLCRVLDACDHLAQKLSADSGSSSKWRPVIRKNDSFNSSTIRLHVPTISDGSHGNSSIYATELYQKDASDTVQKLVFDKFDATQLDFLFVPGALVDAVFSLDVYDYKQSAGIKLVANKLIVNCSLINVQKRKDSERIHQQESLQNDLRRAKREKSSVNQVMNLNGQSPEHILVD